MIISSFTDQYRFLSNFSAHPVKLDGIEYPTVEHAFQAAKTDMPDQRAAICNAPTPGIAKRLGRSVLLRPDWDEVRIEIMYNLLKQKFNSKELRIWLLLTGDAQLIEGNNWGDRFWGVDVTGENNLGKLLMRLRSELRPM